MNRNTNIIGMSIAGTGLMLSLLAGSTAACPEHDKTAKGDPPACSECTVVVKGEAGTKIETVELQPVIVRTGSGGIELGGKSFGDLQFGVASGPEDKKQRVKLKKQAKGAQPERAIRIEIRIVGDDGKVKEFSFDGDDFGKDFDFDFDFEGFEELEGLHELKELKGIHVKGLEDLHVLKELKGLHELKELKGLHEIKELKGLHEIKTHDMDKLHEHLKQLGDLQGAHGQFVVKLEVLEGMNEKLHKHLQQLEVEGLHELKELDVLHEHLQELHEHQNELKDAHEEIEIEFEDIGELQGLSEKIHAQVAKQLKSHGIKNLKSHGENVFVVEGENIARFGDNGHNVIKLRGPEKGEHGVGAWTTDDEKVHVIKRGGAGASVGEWKSDDGKVHVIMKRDGTGDGAGKHQVERHIRLGGGAGGDHEVHVEGGAEGHVVIVGPDGKKKEFNFGGGEGHGEGGEVHKIIKRQIGSASGGGNHEVHVEGGAEGHVVIVGPDGKKQELNFGGGKGKAGNVIKRHRVIKQGEGGNWSTSEDGNVKIEGKAIFIGPDGKPHEVKFGEDGGHELHSNLQSFGTGDGGAFWVEDGDEKVLEVAPGNFSAGGFVADNEHAFFSPEHNITFVPEGENSFMSVGGGDDAAYLSVIDDDTIAIEIKNGKVSAKINGKKVPADRIKRTSKGIEIIGEDGEVVCTVPVMGNVGRFGISGGAGGAPGNVMFGGSGGVGAPQVIRFGAEDQPEPPKVMLGIQMQSVDEEAAHEYDLDEGEGIQIIGVIKGLPAQLAGVLENDIIVEIKGLKGKVTQKGLRGVLLSKDPGDVIAFEVIREGETEDIEIELTPYNAEKLGMVVETPPNIRFGGGEGFRGWQVDAKTQSELVKKYFDRLSDMNFDEHEMEIATEAFEEAMEQMKDQWSEGENRFFTESGGGSWRVIHGDEPDHVFTIPAVPSAAGGKAVSKDIAELKAQLAEVQAQRDELVAELAEIKELLKKLAKDR